MSADWPMLGHRTYLDANLYISNDQRLARVDRPRILTLASLKEPTC